MIKYLSFKDSSNSRSVSIYTVPWEYSLHSTTSWGENTGVTVLLDMILHLASFIPIALKA